MSERGYYLTAEPVGVCSCHACTCPGCRECDEPYPEDRGAYLRADELDEDA